MSLRRLRGLRVQLLLWTILPLAVVLIVLSVGGIARHRQAMTQLVEDRDKSLTLAEANRLSRDIGRRAAALAQAAAALDPSTSAPDLTALASRLEESFAGGLALLDSMGAPLETPAQAQSWAGSDPARVVAARSAVFDQPQHEVLIPEDGPTMLRAAAKAPAARAVVGAIRVETLELAAFGIVQQALDNVAAHAEASSAVVCGLSASA